MKEKVHILIVEDEKNISDILKFNLEKESYDISQRFDGKEGLDFALKNEVDLILLDIMLGAHDYITKPFSVREVVARVKANVRRVEMIENSAVASQLLKFKDIEIDVSKYIVKVRGVEIKITFREFELLKFLAQHRDQVYSREQLLTIVWEYEYIGVDSERTVDVTVRRLREKIETDPSNPEFVITKRGVGYYFAGIPV